MKSNSAGGDFHGQKRRNDTHQSTTDPDARLMRKSNGQEARLSFGAHVLMDSRHGLCADLSVTLSTASEPQAAVAMLARQSRRHHRPAAVAADKGYHCRELVSWCRDHGAAPHIATLSNRHVPGLDGRTLRSKAYRRSQHIRRGVERIFGWCKSVGGLRKTRYRGLPPCQPPRPTGRHRLQPASTGQPPAPTGLIRAGRAKADRKIDPRRRKIIGPTPSFFRPDSLDRALSPQSYLFFSKFLGADCGFGVTSCGFVGVNDGWTDIIKYRRLPIWNYDSASNGTIALTAEIKRDGRNQFVLALAFCALEELRDPDEGEEAKNPMLVAVTEALSYPFDDPAAPYAHLQKFISGWSGAVKVPFTPKAPVPPAMATSSFSSAATSC